MKTKRRLLLPAALVVTAGTGCSGPTPQKPCGSEAHHVCWPDGGYVCPPECGVLRLPDGGPELDSMGQPQCLC